MGTFGGHALPGSFFILFSLWHAINLFQAYFRSKKTFHSAVYFPASCCRLPIEPVLILLMTTVGNIGELITGFKEGYFGNIGNGQHMIMFSCFGLTAFMEILHYYKFQLPPNLLYLCSIFSFMVEALLFYWHLHISAPMEMQVHTLLLYILVATVVCLAVEIIKPRSIAPPFCRVYLFFLQGVWFWQVGFILYPPMGMKAWDWNSHHQMMIVTIIFCLHCGLSFVVLMVLWFAVAIKFGQCRIREPSFTNVQLSSEDLYVCDERLKLVDDEPSSCTKSPLLNHHDEIQTCDY